jgi:hypothetical protein
MPTVFTWNGYRFFFFANEGMPREPRHIHVRKGEKLAKFWLEPDVKLAMSYDMTSAEIGRLTAVVEEHAEQFRRAWDEYFKF